MRSRSCLHLFLFLYSHLHSRRHDFVVVEMIEFYDDEDEELPPPLTLKDVITMNKVS